MKISVSIYAAKNNNLKELVEQLDAHGVDMLHIDCLDDERVFDDIANIRQWSATPIDLHVISPNPERFYPLIQDAAVEYVTFQYESAGRIPDVPTGSKTQFGIAFTASTGVTHLPSIPNTYSHVLFMATEPGKSGGVFQPQLFQQINVLKFAYPQLKVHVDGGVNDTVGFVLRLMGVHAVISGSYVLGHDTIGIGLMRFHKVQGNEQHNQWKVGDFAVPLDYLPVMQWNALNYLDALQTMDKYRTGFVLVTNHNGVLQGVISNADVRKALIKHQGHVSDIQTIDYVNTKPIVLHQNTTITEMLRILNDLNFIVLFLPVVGDDNKLQGVVMLNHLTRV